MTSIPVDHPRYKSLIAREKLERGLAEGITSPTGLIAHGRGEAFDYMLGERTHDFAERACEAAAATLLLSSVPVISVNGNTAVLAIDEMIQLSRSSGILLEINLFHDTPGRRKKIGAAFQKKGADILGQMPDALIKGLSSDRAKVDSRGMAKADTVIVSLEDGDRTAALRQNGKKVIAIDLNPLSRTAQTANITIVDEVTRAFPCLTRYFVKMKTSEQAQLETIIAAFDQQSTLKEAELAIRKGAA